MENVLKFWNFHDISNTTQCYRTRLQDKAPFSSVTDDRLDWLEKEFPEFLQKWKDEATRPEEFLSKRTYEALVLTCKSTAACIRYLLNIGFKFVLTRKFSTDGIERFFGAVRSQNGNNDVPTALNCINAISRIVRKSIGYASINGNVPVERSSAVELRPLAMERQKKPAKEPATSLLREGKLTESEMDMLQEFEQPAG